MLPFNRGWPLNGGPLNGGSTVVGNVEVRREQLIISVKVPRITGRQSLMIRPLILSGPGDLFDGKDKITRRTSSLVTVLKENRSSEEKEAVGGDVSWIEMLFSFAKRIDVFAAFLPTDEKNRLNSFATVFASLV